MLAIFYGSILLLMLPDNGAVDISAGEDLGHVTEQPEDEGGQPRLIHHCRAPGHTGPLELRHLVRIMMMIMITSGVITLTRDTSRWSGFWLG